MAKAGEKTSSNDRLSKYPLFVRGIKKGQTVVITGRLSYASRRQAVAEVRKLGGLSDLREGVTRRTDIVVRGRSNDWKYGDYGSKESAAAKQIQDGRNVVVIDGNDFERLIGGIRVPVLDRVAEYSVESLLRMRGGQGRTEKAASAPVSLSRGGTDGLTLHVLRREQAWLRARLVGDSDPVTCAICRRSIPSQMIVCAHLKRRASCTEKERLDTGNVVLPMCRLGCDSMYEIGYIGIDTRGRVVAAARTGNSSIADEARRISGHKAVGYRSEMKPYTEWHMMNIWGRVH